MANTFADLQPDRLMTVDAYLASIHSGVKRQMTARLITSATSMFEPIRALFKPDAEPPILRIAHNDQPDGQSMEGMVEITTGLIDYCLAIAPADTLGMIGLDTSFEPELVSHAALSWFYAHECHHIIRGHNQLTEAKGYDLETMKATELDADLCAVASLYRVFQGTFGDRFPDNDLRKIIVYCIFWALRQLTDKPQLTHSRPDERLMHVIMKMAMVEVNPFASKPDASGERPETRERIDMLFNLVHHLEQAFRKMNLDASTDFDTLQRTMEMSDLSTTTRWGELAFAQSILTGQRSFNVR